MQKEIITVNDLGKVYRLYNHPIDRLKEAVHPLRRKYHHDFHALKNVSFSILHGETIGIVGKNGSGKSTLLKIIAGVLQPSSGVLHVGGRVSALLELGAGFNPELSGIENIYFSGTISGMSHQEIKAKEDEIVSFADIGEFINQPVKTYSSGMYVRLAFALATCIDPQILIVDEALSVGDMFFQAKSMKRMKLMMERNCTTLFVSHDIHAVKTLCSKVLYLKNGEVVCYGDAAQVCDRYIRDQLSDGGFFIDAGRPSDLELEGDEQSTSRGDPAIKDWSEGKDLKLFQTQANSFRKGSREIEFLYVETLNGRNEPTNSFCYGDEIVLRAYFKSRVEAEEVVCAFYVRDKNQVEVIGTNSFYEGKEIRNVSPGSQWSVEFKFTNLLKSGQYSIQVLLADSLTTTAFFDWVEIAHVFRTSDAPGKTRWALFNPPMPCSVKEHFR
jgi:ABC-type polysaccharide/polyol phosphate transport system ATPase subunit